MVEQVPLLATLTMVLLPFKNLRKQWNVKSVTIGALGRLLSVTQVTVIKTKMEKGNFIFNFFSKKIVLLFAGEEIYAVSKENETVLIPKEWHSEAITVWNNRTLN